MAISAKELAEKLGVSAATISMVMNNKPGISEATRERILRAAAENGYINKKNPLIQNTSVIQLITYKKHGKVLTDTPFFSQLTEGITQECLKQNCALHVSYIQEDASISQQIDQIRSVDCAGILLLATEMLPEDFKWFENMPVPIVVLDCYYESLDFDCIVINNPQGAYQACKHLISHGCRNIGHIGSNTMIANFKERITGYRNALEDNNKVYDPAFDHQISPLAAEGYADMKALIESKVPLADAYFADNDIIAASAMRAFREEGIRVPEDISIIGFDNMPFCDMMAPALSSMNVDKTLFGKIAVKRLLDKLRDDYSGHIKIEINTNLVKRESVSG